MPFKRVGSSGTALGRAWRGSLAWVQVSRGERRCVRAPMLLVVRVSQSPAGAVRTGVRGRGDVRWVENDGTQLKSIAPRLREQDHEGPAPGFLCGPANNVLLPPWRERDRLVRWLASRPAAWRGRAAAWWAGRQARQLRVGHCLALWSGGGGCGEAEAVNCSVEGCNCKQDHRRGWPDPRIARPVRNRSARASRQQRSIESLGQVWKCGFEIL